MSNFSLTVEADMRHRLGPVWEAGLSGILSGLVYTQKTLLFTQKL
jgi:hypothetical protein